MAGRTIRQIVNTSLAPKPVGPYSQAVIADKTIYISGQIGLNPTTGEMVDGGIEQQSEQTLKNMKGVVEGAGSTLSNVVKTTILLKDIADWPKFNSVYEKYFTSRTPARAAYAVAALPKGALVEMEAIAILGDIEEQ